MKSSFLALGLFAFAVIAGCGTSEPTSANNGTAPKADSATTEAPKLPSKAAAAPKE